MDVINKSKQKRLAKAITNEEKGLTSFWIAKKIQKIMNEQQKKKTRKQSQREEEEEKLIVIGHRTKKRHEQSGVSIPVRLAEEKLVP